MSLIPCLESPSPLQDNKFFKSFSTSLRLSCLCVSVYGLCHLGWCTQGGRKRVSDPLELELQEDVSCPVWVLGSKLQSLGRSASAPICGAVSPVSFTSITYLSEVSWGQCCCDKPCPEQLGRTGFIQLRLPHHSSSSKGVRAGAEASLEPKEVGSNTSVGRPQQKGKWTCQWEWRQAGKK